MRALCRHPASVNVCTAACVSSAAMDRSVSRHAPLGAAPTRAFLPGGRDLLLGAGRRACADDRAPSLGYHTVHTGRGGDPSPRARAPGRGRRTHPGADGRRTPAHRANCSHCSARSRMPAWACTRSRAGSTPARPSLARTCAPRSPTPCRARRCAAGAVGMILKPISEGRGVARRRLPHPRPVDRRRPAAHDRRPRDSPAAIGLM